MSQAGTSQFQEVIRQELEYSMKVELDKILATAPSNELEVRSVMWTQLSMGNQMQEIQANIMQGAKSQNTTILIFRTCSDPEWKSSLDTVSVGDLWYHINWVTCLSLSV